MRASQERVTDGLLLSSCLGVAFLLLSFLRTWGDMGSALFGGRVIESTLNHPILGTRLGFRLMGFVAALLLVHLLLGALSWALAHASRRLWPASRNGLRGWSCLWFLLLAAWILLANAALYPASSLGEPYYEFARADLGGISLFALVSTALAIAIVVVFGLPGLRLVSVLSRARRAQVFAMIGLVALGWPLLGIVMSSDAQSTPERPNIIVIGLDSLRTDFVQSGGDAPYTPAVDAFLADAALFTDTVTPLARTFPAWASIVTGRHPHSTGAVINLFPRDLIDEGDTLPDLLQAYGYRTVYAIDEVRFSNLDRSYGFDKMIAPPIGSADFLIGFMYDLPLPNLLANTPAGRHLFPFTHANRAAAITYDPDTFVDRIDDELELDRPIFLAVHLTLSHWPYAWAGTEPMAEVMDAENVRAPYEASVRRMDRQFEDILGMLGARGALENAIVVVLSDHGESLGEPWRAARGNPEGKTRIGHGNDVLAPLQYQVVLAFREYGETPLGLELSGPVDVPASLEDIAPTVAGLFGLVPRQPFDGLSLAAVLRAESGDAASADAAALHNRVRFLETEFNPRGFAVGEIPGQSALEEVAQTYRVDPRTDRLSIRPEMLDKILRGRQYAATQDGAILAALPSPTHDRQTLVFIERGGSPVWLSTVPDAATNPRAHRLFTALNERFATVRERPLVTD